MLEILILLLKVMDLFLSVWVGDLLLSDFNVFQWVAWLFLWFQLLFMCVFQSCCLWFMISCLISAFNWVRDWSCGLLFLVLFRNFILLLMSAGSGLYLFLMLPLGMYRLSAVIIRFVNSCVSLWMLLLLDKLGI